MNQLDMTLQEFWGQFKHPVTGVAIPAYQDHYAVDKHQAGQKAPKFPYIAYPLVCPAYTQSTYISVTVWDKSHEAGFLGLVNSVVDQIASKIPEEGVVLRLNDNRGAVMFFRGSPFVIYPQGDPTDQGIVRGTLNLLARGYMY